MKTFQDLQEAQRVQSAIGEFCRAAVDEFRASPEYKQAVDGEAYYNKHNITIENFKKFLYTISGGKIEDIWSANYKLKTLFFRRLVTQQVQYVTGNGVTFEDENTKKKLGRNFDFMLQRAAKRAMAEGRAFGFWNYDHLEVFAFADTPADPGFAPLYDEKTGQLAAGVRFWFRVIGDDTIFRGTLYEADGYTEYRQVNSDPVETIQEKRAYKTIKTTSPNGTVNEEINENYSRLPIVPLYANDCQESELVGLREDIDCYDFTKSGLANVIDDNADIFWVLQNTGGMEDKDLAKFINRVKTVRAAALDGNEGASAEAHSIEVPYAARQTMLEILRTDIYDDFQALDVKTLSAAAKTTQEIQAAYQTQDNKCADFEYLLIDFVQQILELAGIDDNPVFIWNKVVNQAEQTQMVLSAANVLPKETVIRHLPFLTPEEAEEAIAQTDQQSFNLFNQDDTDGQEEIDGTEEGPQDGQEGTF